MKVITNIRDLREEMKRIEEGINIVAESSDNSEQVGFWNSAIVYSGTVAEIKEGRGDYSIEEINEMINGIMDKAENEHQS